MLFVGEGKLDSIIVRFVILCVIHLANRCTIIFLISSPSPSPSGVLFYHELPTSIITAGNVRFRTAVMRAMHDYHRAEDRTEKPTIVHAIISHTYSTGGCFLRRDNQLPPHSQRDVNPNKNADSNTTTAWVELNFQEQKDKVRHALRDAIAEMKMKQMKSVQCRHEQLLSSRNVRSTTTGNSTSPTIASSNVVMDPVVSMSHLSNSKPLMPTTSIVDDRNYGVVLPSSSNISNIWNTAFPTAPSAVVQQLLLQHHATTTPSTSTNPSATIPNSCESGYPGHQQGTTTMMGPVRNDDLAAQLATQLQLVQMNSQNNMSVSLTLQLYQQLQKEQEIQNVQNFIAMNATKLALQRDCINLQAYVAHLQNLNE